MDFFFGSVEKKKKLLNIKSCDWINLVVTYCMDFILMPCANYTCMSSKVKLASVSWLMISLTAVYFHQAKLVDISLSLKC